MGTPTTTLQEQTKVRGQLQEDTGEIDLLGVLTACKPKEDLDQVFSDEAQDSAERDRLIEQCRHALGYASCVPMVIHTKEFLEDRLRERLHLATDLAEAQEHIKHLQTQLKSWDYLWQGPAEAFYIANPPATGKTLSTKYGQISARTVPESIALDPTDREELELQKELARRIQDQKTAANYGINKVEKVVFTRNLEAIKKDIMLNYEANLMAWKAADPEKRGPKPIPQVWPGMKYSPKRETYSIKHKGIE